MEPTTLKSLCEKIHMPAEIIPELLAAAEGLTPPQRELAEMLCVPQQWKQGLEGLKDSFGEDPNGISILCCSLLAALRTARTYEVLEIPQKIFYDTMGCFSRFVREHQESFGCYGFDRAWWSTRQLSCLLFRLGELEFERGDFQGAPSVHIHIPSDADISPVKCAESYRMALSFWKTYFPDFSYESFSCSSWMLSPALGDVLGESSKILQFQRSFSIVENELEDMEYKQWIFKDRSLAVDALPEETSLQRNVKRYIQAGKNIGSAKGIVRPDILAAL